jgi:catechol 2,3-dioxygenase
MTTEPLDVDGVLASAEGDLPDAANGVDVGHVHLKVADVEDAVAFWTQEVGMELMARYGADAAFIAADGYHHHVGANRWYSRGAALEPRDGPGLDRVVIAGAAERALTTPDGVEVALEP